MCCWKRAFAITSAFSWQNYISLCPASFCTPRPNLPVPPGVSGEGNGNPLQYSYLENPVDRRAWWAAIYGVTQGWTWLKQLSLHACIGEGNGNPFKYSCLENPRDRGAWWAAIYGVTQGWTRLRRLSSSQVFLDFLLLYFSPL